MRLNELSINLSLFNGTKLMLINTFVNFTKISNVQKCRRIILSRVTVVWSKLSNCFIRFYVTQIRFLCFQLFKSFHSKPSPPPELKNSDYFYLRNIKVIYWSVSMLHFLFYFLFLIFGSFHFEPKKKVADIFHQFVCGMATWCKQSRQC